MPHVALRIILPIFGLVFAAFGIVTLVLMARGGRVVEGISTNFGAIYLLTNRRAIVFHISIFGSDQIADVTGAGDTVIATMTLALAAGGTAEEAARLANYTGGLVVMKRGTATVTADELKQAIRGDRG